MSMTRPKLRLDTSNPNDPDYHLKNGDELTRFKGALKNDVPAIEAKAGEVNKRFLRRQILSLDKAIKALEDSGEVSLKEVDKRLKEKNKLWKEKDKLGAGIFEYYKKKAEEHYKTKCLNLLSSQPLLPEAKEKRAVSMVKGWEDNINAAASACVINFYLDYYREEQNRQSKELNAEELTKYLDNNLPEQAIPREFSNKAKGVGGGMLLGLVAGGAFASSLSPLTILAPFLFATGYGFGTHMVKTMHKKNFIDTIVKSSMENYEKELKLSVAVALPPQVDSGPVLTTLPNVHNAVDSQVEVARKPPPTPIIPSSREKNAKFEEEAGTVQGRLEKGLEGYTVSKHKDSFTLTKGDHTIQANSEKVSTSAVGFDEERAIACLKAFKAMYPRSEPHHIKIPESAKIEGLIIEAYKEVYGKKNIPPNLFASKEKPVVTSPVEKNVEEHSTPRLRR